MKKIVILGGGISGLSCAWYLKKMFQNSVEYLLIEESNRFGGMIQSVCKDGFLFELGPRGCRPRNRGISTLKLVEELNLQSQVIGAASNARNRFLWNEGELNLVNFTSKFIWKAVWPMFCNLFSTRSKFDGDVSVDHFFRMIMGDYFTDTVIDPMTAGIYAGRIDHLSAQSCYHHFFEVEQSYGSLSRGLLYSAENSLKEYSEWGRSMRKHALFSFRDGMETLPKKLSEHLDIEKQLNTTVLSITKHQGKWVIHTSKGEFFADVVISTLPSNVFETITSSALDLSPVCKERASVVVVNVGFKKSVLKQKGFGYLISSKEKENILGCIWDSDTFPEQNHSKEETRLTFMLGGGRQPHLIDASDSEIQHIVMEGLKKHLLVHQIPEYFSIQRCRLAIPQYSVGHLQRVQKLEKKLHQDAPFLYCLGNSFYGVSVNDCIHHAKELAKKVKLNLQKK